MSKHLLLKFSLLAALVLVVALLVIVSLFTNQIQLTHAWMLTALLVFCTFCVAIPLYVFNEVKRSLTDVSQSIKRDNIALQSQREALLRITSSKVLHSGDINLAIRELTQAAAYTLNVERVGVWIFSPDRESIKCICLFEKSKHAYGADRIVQSSDAPLYFEYIKNNRIVVADTILSNPITAELTYLEDLGIRSLIDAPIYVNGVLFGILCHEHVGPARTWTIDEQNFAISMADMVAMAFEVHERRKVEGELRRKSRAIEASLEGIAIIERDESLSFVNQAFARMFGYSEPAELIGKPWKLLYEPHQLKKLERHVFISFRRAGNLQCEATGLRKNGTKFFQELSLTSLGDGGLVCVVRDISQRKEVEQSLLQSRKFLRKVIDLNPNFIFVKDGGGRFCLANQAVAEVYGTTVENLIGKTDSYFNPAAEEVEHFSKDDQYVIKEGKELVIQEEKITDSSGKVRYLHTVKRPLQDPRTKEVFVLGVAGDITDRKGLEAQLLQSQKMEALGQLAGGVAHDFNNLMTGILGYTTLIRMTPSEEGEVLKAADVIEKAAVRAAELTQKLLGFARKGKNQNIPVDLHLTIQDTLGILSRTVETNISIVTSLEATEAMVLGDPVQIQQIILNLALNARDAMRLETGGTIGGTLEICTRNLKGETGLGNNGEGPQWVEIVVRDTGCGIDEEHKDRVFEPFFTTKGEGKGTGMGLAMVYGIVSNHGGKVSLESVKGKGTAFTILLPVTHLRADQRIEKRYLAPQLGKGTVLVVDDHEVVRQATSDMLASLGYQVITANDGVEALACFRKYYDKIDVVILDLVMPRMGAQECLEALRRIDPHVRAILSTGYIKDTMVQRLLDRGVCGFIQKPFHIEELSELISRALQNTVPRDSSVPRSKMLFQ